MYQYLEVDFSWQENDLQVFLPILLCAVFFVLYWAIGLSEKIKKNFYEKYDFDTASTKHFFFVKACGFFLMGVVPLATCLIFIPNLTLTDYGLTFYSKTAFFSFVWILVLSILVLPIIAKGAKKPDKQPLYPQIRANKWTKKIMLTNLGGWALYLLGYELLFRAVLLTPLVEPLGVWPAIGVNIALYSISHLPKGAGETISSIPFGLVLCLLTLASGTVWIAVIVHILVAWTNSLVALKHHPDIHYYKKTQA